MKQLVYYNCPQTKFVKVMFSQVSVCPRGVCLIACWDTPSRTRSRHPPGTRSRHPQADNPLGIHPLLGRQPPPWAVHAGIRSTSGRYASHWNTVLFQENPLCNRHPPPKKRVLCRILQDFLKDTTSNKIV